jgi:hypothetical protein
MMKGAPPRHRWLNQAARRCIDISSRQTIKKTTAEVACLLQNGGCAMIHLFVANIDGSFICWKH